MSRKASSFFDGAWSSRSIFFFSSRRRHTRFDCDWSSDVCSSDLLSSLAQEERAPLQLADFDTQGSVSLGYRYTEFKGREQKFLELFDLQKGFRLADFSLVGQAKEGAVPFADSYSLTMSGLGGDPYPGGQFTLRKNKLYDLRVSYRQSYNYWDRNDDAILPTGLHGLTTNHNWATVRRFGSVNLTLPATNNLRFNFDDTRSGRDGVHS